MHVAGAKCSIQVPPATVFPQDKVVDKTSFTFDVQLGDSDAAKQKIVEIEARSDEFWNSSSQLVSEFGMKPHAPSVKIVESMKQLLSRPSSQATDLRIEKLELELEEASKQLSERNEEVEEVIQSKEELARRIAELQEELEHSKLASSNTNAVSAAYEESKQKATEEVIEDLVHDKENLKLALEREEQHRLLTMWILQTHKREAAKRSVSLCSFV